MRNDKWMLVAMGALIAVAGLGCASRAPSFNGRWKPVNQFATTTEAIPLVPSYVFYASPTDGTLRTMLARWAKDSGRTLSYQHPNDFTLHAPAAEIRTPDLRQALSALTGVYASQQVSIRLEQETIVVQDSLYVRAYDGLKQLGRELGFADEGSYVNAAATLAVQARTNGLRHLDHVLHSTHGRNLIAVQGKLDDPANHCIHVDKGLAAAQPIQLSTMQADFLRQKQETERSPDRDQRMAITR